MNTENLTEFEKYMIAQMKHLKTGNEVLARELHLQRDKYDKLQTKLDETHKFVKEKLNDKTLISTIRYANDNGDNSVDWGQVLGSQARLFDQIIQREEDLEKQIEKGFKDTHSSVVRYGKQW
ncbi:MAG: hypothetical protein Q9M43_03590 [Sulfurimonas sp.]|nr:hypothetical protein [Sulfurimonas sp.]